MASEHSSLKGTPASLSSSIERLNEAQRTSMEYLQVGHHQQVVCRLEQRFSELNVDEHERHHLADLAKSLKTTFILSSDSNIDSDSDEADGSESSSSDDGLSFPGLEDLDTISECSSWEEVDTVDGDTDDGDADDDHGVDIKEVLNTGNDEENDDDDDDDEDDDEEDMPDWAARRLRLSARGYFVRTMRASKACQASGDNELMAKLVNNIRRTTVMGIDTLN